MGIKQELGKKIRRMRISRGLTQEALAEMTDMSQRALSRIETGENFVSSETLDKLIIALNTSSEELFSLSHLKNKKEMLKEIQEKIQYISHNEHLLEIIYKLVMSLSKE